MKIQTAAADAISLFGLLSRLQTPHQTKIVGVSTPYGTGAVPRFLVYGA
jgi:hypothetical protein